MFLFYSNFYENNFFQIDLAISKHPLNIMQRLNVFKEMYDCARETVENERSTLGSSTEVSEESRSLYKLLTKILTSSSSLDQPNSEETRQFRTRFNSLMILLDYGELLHFRDIQ